MSNDTIPMKTCTKCGQTFPATTEFFNRDYRKEGRLKPRCRRCMAIARHEWYVANHQRELEKSRLHMRQYRDANREILAKKSRDYYHKNREKGIASRRRYYKNNREQVIQKTREWHKANPEKVRASRHRRKARKRNLPNTLTSEQWQACLEYHHYCCAVCGNQLRGLLSEIIPTADHWLPLNNPISPGTVADNMICLCNPCNCSKQDTRPEEWLEREYGKRKAKQILKRVEDYFEWVRRQQ